MRYSNKTVLITGGSGFLGNQLAKVKFKEIRIFSRDESLQEKMKCSFPNLKYILGDVRDYQALKNALTGVDIVIHAAAVKYLDWAELQPTDCLKTNILGSVNVINACMDAGVKLCVGCSTDKAPHAVNVYGCSKQIMEALFHEANQYGKTKFLITRYGNVIGSTGSIIPKWKQMVKDGKDLLVTGRDMRRFLMTPQQAVNCVLECIKTEKDCIPTDLKAIDMWKLAEIIADGKVKVKAIPKRPGERDFEILTEYFTTNDAKSFTKEEIKEII